MKLRDFPNGVPFKFVEKNWVEGPCIAADLAGTIKVTSVGRPINRIYVNSGTMYVIDDADAANAEVEAVQDRPKISPVRDVLDAALDAARYDPYLDFARAIPSTSVKRTPRPLNKERYYHIPIKDHPRVKYVTVYAKEIDGIWYTDAAYCAKGDNFSREVGRSVARNRFQLNTKHGCGKGHGNWGTKRPKYEDVVWWATATAKKYVK